MLFGKKHPGDVPETDEPVGIEALGEGTTGTSGATSPETPTETAKLPEGVPDLGSPGAVGTDGGAGGPESTNPYAAEPTPKRSPFAVLKGAVSHGATGKGAGADAMPQGLDAAEQEAYEQLRRMRAERRRKKLIRRGIVAGVFVAILAAIGIWRFVSTQQTQTNAVQVVTQPVFSGPFSSAVSGSGSIKPISSTVVSPGIDGTIEQVNVVAGQQVNAGDVLFTVKNDDLDRAVAEATRGVKTAKSGLAQANSALDLASEGLKSAKDALKKAKAQATEMPDGSDPTAAAKEAVTSAQQSYDSAASNVESAKLQLEAANDQLAQAQQQADKRTVKAPAAGSIIELNAQPGASLSQIGANAGQGGTGALCQIADLSQMTVTVQISEIDINKVQVGQAATATFSAVTDAALDASVRSIATTSSTDGGGGYYGGGYGGSGVTYAVDLVIPSPDPRLKPGMTADVSITTQAIDNALIVPTAALNDMGDGTGMLVVEDDAETHDAHTVQVDVLANNGSEAAVEAAEGSALAEGDAVIVSGSEAANISGDGGVGAPGAAGGSASAAGGDASSYVEYDENGNVTGAGGSAKVD